MPSSATRRRPPRLPYNHGEPIWRCRYDVIAGVLFAVTAFLIWVDWPQETHALKIDVQTELPSMPTWVGAPNAVTNVLVVQDDGLITWNGESVAQSELLENLDSSMALPVESELIFAPDPNASYDLSLRVLAVVKSTGVTKLCFGGLEQHRHWNNQDGSSVLALLTSVWPQNSQISLHQFEPLPNPPRCSLPAAGQSVWTN